MKPKISEILESIKEVEKNKNSENTLPENTYYLNNNSILCLDREFGESRYPYEMDGLNLWAHSTGYINACESRLTIFRKEEYNGDPDIDFWGGIKHNDNWIPISILGATKQLLEPSDVKRYVVYEKRAVYYIADTQNITFSVRASITTTKKINFTVSAINKTNESHHIYLASYVDPLIRTNNYVRGGNKIAEKFPNGDFLLKVQDEMMNYCVINRTISNNFDGEIKSTASRNVFFGDSKSNVFNAKSLKSGNFFKEIYKVNITHTPVNSDILIFEIKENEEVVLNYSVSTFIDEDLANKQLKEKINISDIEKDILFQEKKETEKLCTMNVKFDKMENVDNILLNKFFKNVQKQVDFCALGKNYVTPHLGMRDVFQQLETALMWCPDKAKKQIVKCLDFIISNGRTPRQISFPQDENISPEMDMREYIDQGIWIIDALYAYLSFTNDYSILDEKCSYYIISEEKPRYIFEKGEATTVLEHLLRITDYLISNIDSDTNCLKILIGDWNDPFNGLGRTKDKDKEFGNGVSVMASEQLYRNLDQMTHILRALNKYCEKQEEYMKIRENIALGLEKYALEKNENGEYHIIHGWGDKMSFRTCTLKDSDGVRRYSAVVNSYWCVSDMIKRNPTIKKDIIKAYCKLDSKYGIKTFNIPFTPDMTELGAIVNTPFGTYENACAYVHSTMFAVMALYILGEGKFAWEQIEKAIPINHSFLSKTPFVMPNSYVYNEEFSMDGESLGDWYTGSGAVLLRAIIKYCFGIKPDLNGLEIETALYMPTNQAEINLIIKGCNVCVIYKNEKNSKRKYFVNGKEEKTYLDEVSSTTKIYIENSRLNGKIIIEVVD